MNWNGFNLPEPYYQDDAVYIIHGNCRDILPLIPDKSIDLVLTDFPYGNETDYGDGYKDTPEELQVLIDNTMPDILRTGKLAGMTTGIGNLYKYPQADWIFAWFIGMEGNHSTPYGFNCWQPILVYGKDPYLARGLGRRADVILRDNGKNPINFTIKHPCPKPIQTWSQLIVRLCPDKEAIILDPFLGSGTTAYCAKKLGRFCIGIEIEEKYCEIAAKRCSQSAMKLEC